jgi:hypothetical protein
VRAVSITPSEAAAPACVVMEMFETLLRVEAAAVLAPK